MSLEAVGVRAATLGAWPRKVIGRLKPDADQVVQQAAKDRQLHADELALIRDLTKGQDAAKVASRFEKQAGMDKMAAMDVSRLLEMPDELFNRKLAVDKHRPVILKLVDGKIAPESQQDLGRPFSTEGHSFTLIKQRAAYAVKPGKEAVFNFSFTGTHPAVCGTITIGARDIPYVAPKNPPPNLPTPEMVAKSLALLPDRYLKLIDKIVLNPVPHRKDQKEKDSSAVAAMAGQGDITFFPLPWANSQDDWDATTLHEIGHLVHQKENAFTRRPGRGWEEAIRKDGNGVSEYGDTSRSEDFAETFSLYLLGGKYDPKLRQRYPNRFALLDKEIG